MACDSGQDGVCNNSRRHYTPKVLVLEYKCATETLKTHGAYILQEIGLGRMGAGRRVQGFRREDGFCMVVRGGRKYRRLTIGRVLTWMVN
jgi:hypothetical protein